MANDLHHVFIHVIDINWSLYLFRDILGLKLQWHQVVDLSPLVGMDDMKAEIVYLQGHQAGVAIELVRLIRSAIEEKPYRFGMAGSTGLSLVVEDLDGLHERLTKEGCIPFTPSPIVVHPPEEEALRVCLYHAKEGWTLELIEKIPFTDQKEGLT